MRSESFKREREEVAKLRAKRYMKRSWPTDSITPRKVGHMATTHCKPCSCTSCGNPRRHFPGRAGLTMAEKRANQEFCDL